VRLVVRPGKNISGNIKVPADKSISHRALILGSIADGVSHVRNWLPSGDCMVTLDAMRAMGINIEMANQTVSSADISIHGVGKNGLIAPSQPIWCGGSGTTMRILSGLVAGQTWSATLDGHAGLRRRPMERIAEPLRLMGAEVQTREGLPPLRISGGELNGIDFKMRQASGQVQSAIMVAALYAKGKTTIRQGPSRDHTARMLREMGVEVQETPHAVIVSPLEGELKPLDISVCGDMSSAAFPLVASLILPDSSVQIQKVGINPTRTGLVDVLREMGAEIDFLNPHEEANEPVADVSSHSIPLQAVQVGGDTVVRMIDEFPIFAVAATQAQGKTTVHDAQELRVKETDRIKAIVDELRKMGAQIIALPDGFDCYGPSRLHGAIVQSDGDHRIAMALAVAGLLATGETIIEGAEVIADSFPGFEKTMQSLGAEITIE
jgi:3-phosphoshikimate 1-carboxyvinyltransferase